MKIFLNKKIGVLGLSRTGLSSVKFLKKKGFNIYGWDDNNKKFINSKKKFNIHNLNNNNLKKQSFLIVSPGIHSSGKKRHPFLKKADKAKIEILNDIELFYRFNPEEKISFTIKVEVERQLENIESRKNLNRMSTHSARSSH